MPYRKEILATGEIYHVFNRSAYEIPIFESEQDVAYFAKAMVYYLQPAPPIRLSLYLRNKENYQPSESEFLVKIIAYCLMPTHFHFMLRQEKDNGIRKYFQRLCNSYSHYFNLKHQQRNPLYKGPFRAKRVKTNEQLLHLSRYIHLNPVSDFLVENPKNYPSSSYSYYLNGNPPTWLDPFLVISQFSDIKDYERFVLARKDYQRQLTKIKHLLLE